MVGRGRDSTVSGEKQTTGSRTRVNETSGSIGRWQIFDQLKNY